MRDKDSEIVLPKGTKVPDHVVIMPDGDRRWARARGLTPSEGHKAGMENMVKLARVARRWGIHTVSAWGLSTENWLERPKEEIAFLMKGITSYLDRFVDEMDKEGVRVVHLGRKDRLPEFLLVKIAEVESRTRNNNKHIFNIGLDYNGWDEVVRATRKIVTEGIKPEEINRKTIDLHMDTADQPYPYIDLYIRTSGEQRTSGFMMWQADYAEFYWEEEYFPAFTPDKLREAIIDYSRRRRRFGGDDAMEHFKFDPKVIAKLELDMRKLKGTEPKRLRDLAVEYIKEQYGMSMDLANKAGASLAKALRYRDQQEWENAKTAMVELYKLIKKNVGLALEPEIVASIEVGTWKNKGGESDVRQLVAEKYRFSEFQATKSAHLAYLADQEAERGEWKKAGELMERYYQALKERVA